MNKYIVYANTENGLVVRCRPLTFEIACAAAEACSGRGGVYRVCRITRAGYVKWLTTYQGGVRITTAWDMEDDK